jgi:hypothetical protein
MHSAIAYVRCERTMMHKILCSNAEMYKVHMVPEAQTDSTAFCSPYDTSSKAEV